MISFWEHLFLKLHQEMSEIFVLWLNFVGDPWSVSFDRAVLMGVVCIIVLWLS